MGIWNCHRLLKIHFVIAIHLIRWLANFYDFRWKEQLLQELEYTLLKPDCHSWWISKMKSGTSKKRYAIKFCFKLGKNATETDGMLQTAFRPSCTNRASVFEWHKRFKEGSESVRDDERCGRSKEVRTPELIGQRVRVRLRCWGFNGIQEEIPSEEASTLQIGSVAFPPMHQSTTPPLSQTIWPRFASRQFISLPIVQTLLPETFGYSISSEAVVIRQLRRWKRLWRRPLTRSHKMTSMGPCRSFWNGTTSALQPEEINSKKTWV